MSDKEIVRQLCSRHAPSPGSTPGTTGGPTHFWVLLCWSGLTIPDTQDPKQHHILELLHWIGSLMDCESPVGTTDLLSFLGEPQKLLIKREFEAIATCSNITEMMKYIHKEERKRKMLKWCCYNGNTSNKKKPWEISERKELGRIGYSCSLSNAVMSVAIPMLMPTDPWQQV